MIKCKLHPYEQGEGVCASCLRDRLLVLHAAQQVTSPEIHLPPPPALSSYVSHRLSNDYDTASDASDDRDHHGYRRFYHTPQISGRNQNGCRSFSKLSSLFYHHHRHRSDESEPSASWFSSLIHGRRKKRSDTRSPSSPPALRKVKTFGVLDRGMSPMRGDETEDNASESGYSTESSATWRPPARPRREAAERRRRNGGVFSGFAVCLSPLVRAGPTSRRSHVPELGFSSEVRGIGIPVKNGHVSGFGGSFGPNRSRKLADGGRFR